MHRRALLRYHEEREDSLNDWVDPDFYTREGAGLEVALGSLALGSSPLALLPPELLLIVGEKLGAVDFLAFRASSRRTYEILNRIRSTVLRNTIFDKSAPMHLAGEGPCSEAAVGYYKAGDELAIRFHRDQYSRLASLEDSPSSEKLLCSYCLDLHPRAAFSSDEVAKGPHKRTCKGALRTVRVCEHVSLTFKDVVSLLQHCIVSDTSVFRPQVLCPRGPSCHWQYSSPVAWNSGRMLPSLILVNEHLIPLYGARGQQVVKTPEPRVLTPETRHEPRLASVSHEYISDKLRAMNMYICPHLRSSDVAVLQQLQKKARGVYAVYGWLTTKNPSRLANRTDHVQLCRNLPEESWPVEDAYARCEVPGCKVTANVHISLEDGTIGLKVVRIIGLVLVTDGEWLASTEETAA